VSVAALDQDLVARCVAGQRVAWRELHQNHHARVARVLRRLGVPPTEIDDCSQEVFVQVFRYVARFERRADFATWLYRICIGQASRYRRSRLPQLLRWLTASPPEVSTLGPDWSEREAARRVGCALDRLKPADRIALVLYEFEGLSGEQIAQVTASPVATVWRRLHHARRDFEKWLLEGPMEGRA
jgi:RNA polymerase sigma-70 factor (ECF subfamily)